MILHIIWLISQILHITFATASIAYCFKRLKRYQNSFKLIYNLVSIIRSTLSIYITKFCKFELSNSRDGHEFRSENDFSCSGCDMDPVDGCSVFR